jgi:hypothetical protein
MVSRCVSDVGEEGVHALEFERDWLPVWEEREVNHYQERRIDVGRWTDSV